MKARTGRRKHFQGRDVAWMGYERRRQICDNVRANCKYLRIDRAELEERRKPHQEALFDTTDSGLSHPAYRGIDSLRRFGRERVVGRDL